MRFIVTAQESRLDEPQALSALTSDAPLRLCVENAMGTVHILGNDKRAAVSRLIRPSCLGSLQPWSLDDLARTDTTGARTNVRRLAVNHGPDSLQVGQPTPFADVVCVGDIAPGHRSLAADFTSLRHFSRPPRGPQENGDAFHSIIVTCWQGRSLPNDRVFSLSVQKTECECELSRAEIEREIDGNQRK